MSILRSIKSRFSGGRFATGATAMGGMVIGAIVGIAVQAGIDSTGLLGPSVESLLAEQQSSFNAVHARLDKLRGSTADPDLSRELTELADLIQKQEELRQQAKFELIYLVEQVTSLEHGKLADRGFSGGSDFWLKTGESVSVGDRRNVLGIVRMWDKVVDVNLSGKKSRLKVGDSISTDDCTVFFKQGVLRGDGRVGFDLICS